MIAAAWICLLLPLGGALAITLAGNSINRRAAGIIATGSVAGAFAAAVWSFVAMLGRDEEERAQASTAWSWLTAGNLDFGLEIYVDQLAVFMMLIVSGVGALIVGYSIGYMDKVDEERRFFAYMAFFVFSMLLLVEGGNLLMLLAAWGLVGLSSYLLIGFEHERPAAIAAAKKAFIMNAVGDATFALALFLLIQQTGVLGYEAVFAEVDGLSSTTATLVALGLLGGAVAKSAQLPLQTWLPDAMEGPTPVSALIHAATMVVAGVYLIFRTAPVFEAAPEVQDTAAILGALTLVAAGLIALVQTDIKRVIAYSTMSQIGYMFLAVGIGAYATGMFHLLTHAFFKALLFLAAGILIHALAGEQDLRKMGGLRRLMPFTYVAFLVGALALVGVPPFSGFFSKDPILANALDAGDLGYVLFALAAAGALLTGLYTFRMIFLAFGGEPSEELKARYHPHGGKEGPRSMVLVVGVLTVLSAIAGFLQYAPYWTPVDDFLEPVAEPLVHATNGQETFASIVAVSLGLAGVAIAWLVYSSEALPRAAAVGGARGEALLRRSLRRALLPAGRRDGEAVLRARRRAARRRVADRHHVRHRPARRLRPRAADGHRADVRPRRRGRARRPRPRLHLGVVPLMGSWVTTALIVLPAAGALVLWAAPLATRSRRGRRPRREPRRGRALDRGARRLRLRRGHAARSSTRSRRRGSAISASRTTSASSASGSGWPASPSSARRRPSRTRCAPAASARARTTGSCSSSPGRSSASSAPRICCSSTSSGRRCSSRSTSSSACGEVRAGSAQRCSSSSTRWPARC